MILIRVHAAAARPTRESPEGWVSFILSSLEEIEAEVREAAREETIEKVYRVSRDEDPSVPTYGEERVKLVPIPRSQVNERVESAQKAAFVALLPPLTSRTRAQAFIACITVGVQRKLIKMADAKPLFYAAQVALIAHGKRAKRNSGGRVTRFARNTPPPAASVEGPEEQK